MKIQKHLFSVELHVIELNNYDVKLGTIAWDFTDLSIKFCKDGKQIKIERLKIPKTLSITDKQFNKILDKGPSSLAIQLIESCPESSD